MPSHSFFYSQRECPNDIFQAYVALDTCIPDIDDIVQKLMKEGKSYINYLATRVSVLPSHCIKISSPFRCNGLFRKVERKTSGTSRNLLRRSFLALYAPWTRLMLPLSTSRPRSSSDWSTRSLLNTWYLGGITTWSRLITPRESTSSLKYCSVLTCSFRFLGKIRNGKIKIKPGDFPLGYYEDAMSDLADPLKGLFMSPFLIEVSPFFSSVSST
jgi:hypothetical protein